MPVSEFGAATRLVAAAADGVTTVVRDMHRAIAARAFPRGTGAVKLAHDGIVELTYGCVRGGLRAGGGLASLLPVHRFSLQRSAAGRRTGAVLGGYVGDRLHERGDPLMYDMAVRAEGTDIAPEWTSLRAVYPNPSSELVVFLHGLIESEQWWFPRDHPDFGTRLATDLDLTPVYLRYNTGRHICDNAAALDALLTTVLEQWPVPVTGLSLIGHSMGGLVTRSALHLGQDRHRDWVSALRHVVYLGTPHRGSTVEVGANLAASALAAFAESAPLARPLRLRSAGIKDLRFGYLTKQDWLGHDQDAPFASPPKPLREPPPSHVREHFLAVTVSRNPRGTAANLFGDLVVTPNSAADSAGADTADRIRLGGLNHFNLCGHETVYDRLHGWLGEPPRPEL